jgi:hypothetical protein
VVALSIAGCGGSQSKTGAAPKQDPVAARTKQIQDCLGKEGLSTRPRGQLSGSIRAFEATGDGKVVSYVFVFDSQKNASAAQKAIFAELDPRGAVAARTVRDVVVASTFEAADHQPALDECLDG